MRRHTAQAAAPESDIRRAVAAALTARGPHVKVIDDAPGRLVIRVGAEWKTFVFGAFTSNEKWPCEISLVIDAADSGSTVDITVDGQPSYAGSIAGMLMDKQGKCEQLWADRVVTAIEGMQRPTATTGAARKSRAPGSGSSAAAPGVTAVGKTGATACTGCGASIPVGARFCVECGQPASRPATCPKCEGAAGDGKFCSNCGADLRSTPGREPKRRRATPKASTKKERPPTGGSKKVAGGKKRVRQSTTRGAFAAPRA